MTPQRFVTELAALRFDDAFNPYSDHCDVYDTENAPSKRAAMLTDMLEAASKMEVDAIWIGRDLGYLGGRRTGLAFTDDVHLAQHQARWGISTPRPTKGKALAERSATVVWQLLDGIDAPIFLWNAFPLHPHHKDDPRSNRKHTAAEGRSGALVLGKLLSLLRPKRLVAIGNDAEHVIRQYANDFEVIKVRHPSYGGKADFMRGIRDLYGSPPLGPLL